MSYSSIEQNSYGKSPVSFDPNRDSYSDGAIERSIDDLTASMATTCASEELDQTAEVIGQLQKLIKQQFQAKEKNYAATIKNLTENLAGVTQKNESLLTQVDIVTRECVAEVLKTMVLEITLRDNEENLARSKLENSTLQLEIESNKEEFDDLDSTNTRLEVENSLLVGYVKNDLLKLAAATQAQDLLSQLKPSNSIDLASVLSQLQGVDATLKSLQQFGTPDTTRTHLVKVFDHLIKQIEVWKQEQIEASKPLDQPKLERLIDSLRRHLIRYQFMQVRELLKECNQSQIQPILPNLEKDLKKLWRQVKQFRSSEESQAAATVYEGQKTSSWWWAGI